MDIETAIAGVLQERSALQQSEGLSPSYISEHMYALTQYNGSLEEILAEEEKKLELQEAKFFKGYRAENMSVNAAQVQTKYDVAPERAEIIRLTRLCNSSWRFISSAQSRIKHLLAEAQNQI